MKCPINKVKLAGKPDKVLMECIGKECEWWDKEGQHCVVTYIGNIESFLDAIYQMMRKDRYDV